MKNKLIVGALVFSVGVVPSLAHEGQVYVKQGILGASFEYPTGGAKAIEVALKRPIGVK